MAIHRPAGWDDRLGLRHAQVAHQGVPVRSCFRKSASPSNTHIADPPITGIRAGNDDPHPTFLPAFAIALPRLCPPYDNGTIPPHTSWHIRRNRPLRPWRFVRDRFRLDERAQGGCGRWCRGRGGDGVTGVGVDAVEDGDELSVRCSGGGKACG